MKIEINPEKNQSVQAVNTADAVSAVSANVEGKNNTAGGLTRDMWDKRNLANSLKDAWDSDDTAVISVEAKRGIVGDPRIVGDEITE